MNKKHVMNICDRYELHNFFELSMKFQVFVYYDILLFYENIVCNL